MSILAGEVAEQSQVTTMDHPHQDVKPSVRERLGERRRSSRSLSPDDSEERRRNVKPKFSVEGILLECVICKNQLSTPLCQCKNGHLACQSCCRNRTRAGQCPECAHPIGRFRNRAVEKMLASLLSPCKHAVNGCKKMLTSATKKQHELYDCEFMLLECPFPGCRFTSSIRKYSAHVEQKHKDTRILRRCNERSSSEQLTFGGFYLDSRDEFVVLKACPELFLLHQEDVSPLGHMLYVTSCGTEKRYSLEVTIHQGSSNEHERGHVKNFKVETVTNNGRSLTNNSSSSLRDFLLVPKQNIPAHRQPTLSARCTVVIPQEI